MQVEIPAMTTEKGETPRTEVLEDALQALGTIRAVREYALVKYQELERELAAAQDARTTSVMHKDSCVVGDPFYLPCDCGASAQSPSAMTVSFYEKQLEQKREELLHLVHSLELAQGQLAALEAKRVADLNKIYNFVGYEMAEKLCAAFPEAFPKETEHG
jgi:hypothetical protein